MTDKQFIQRLSSVLSHNAINKDYLREKSGKINSKRIGLFGVTERFFTKKSQEKLEREYTISILMDVSGSMGRMDPYSRLGNAADNIIALARSLDKIKNIRYEIVLFSSSSLIVKEYDSEFDENNFKESVTSWQGATIDYYINQKTKDVIDLYGKIPLNQVVKNHSDYRKVYSETNAGSNIDHYIIADCYRRIQNEKGKKIMFVFSDGQPTISGLSFVASNSVEGSDVKLKTVHGNRDLFQYLDDEIDPQKHLRKITNIIKRDKEIDLISIGIHTDYVKAFYPIWDTIYDNSELFPKTIKLLSKVIKKI